MSQSDVADVTASRRKTPLQKRSKERVERMLSVASALIAEKGSDGLKMSEVAERAEVPVGSLYQFFPDKSAIVRTLVERCHRESRECIAEGLEGVRTVAEFRRAFSDLYDVYYQMFLAGPVMRDIWQAAQADKSLAALELAESRANGEVVAEVLSRIKPRVDLEHLRSTAFLIMALGEATIRLAVSVERTEGDRLIEGYKRMALKELLSHTTA